MIISTWKILLWLHVLYSRLCLGPVCHYYHHLHTSLLPVHVISGSSAFVCRGRQKDAFNPARPATEGLSRLKRLLLHQPHMLVFYEGTTPWAFNWPEKAAHCCKSNCPPRNNTYFFILINVPNLGLPQKTDLCDLHPSVHLFFSWLQFQCLPLNTGTKSNKAVTFWK